MNIIKELKMSDNYWIYKWMNRFTGEIYIGATTGTFNRRCLDHIAKANKNAESKFHQAISTYGPDAFEYEIISTAGNLNDLAHQERVFIAKYDSIDNGYNSIGGGGFKKIVYQYDLNGEYVNKYNSLKEAADCVESKEKAISKACLSKKNLHKGFYWNYEFREPFIPESDKRRKRVGKFNKAGILLEKYSSIADASRKTNVNKTSIAKVCRGERIYAGGYVWRFDEPWFYRYIFK